MTLPAPLVEAIRGAIAAAVAVDEHELAACTEEVVHQVTAAWPAALAALATPSLREAVEGAVEAAFAAAHDERSTATHVLATVAPIVEALRAEVAEADDVTATLAAKIIAMQAESRELRAVAKRDADARWTAEAREADLRAQVAALEAELAELRAEVERFKQRRGGPGDTSTYGRALALIVADLRRLSLAGTIGEYHRPVGYELALRVVYAMGISTIEVASPSALRGSDAAPWPPREVLAKLVAAVDHLLRDHDCDHHSYEEYEEVGAARDAAAAIIGEG